jgi:hypothetical protein
VPPILLLLPQIHLLLPPPLDPPRPLPPLRPLITPQQQIGQIVGNALQSKPRKQKPVVVFDVGRAHVVGDVAQEVGGVLPEG